MKSFQTILLHEAQSAGMSAGGIEPFGDVPYHDELKVKQAAVQQFSREILKKADVCSTVVKAPRPRHYRTTSRRRLWHEGKRFTFVHGDGSRISARSPLEQKEHLQIYESVAESLARLDHKVRAAFHHVVVRGTYSEYALIITTTHLDAEIVRACRQVALKAQKQVSILKHAWIYVDERRSRYYLELERPIHGIGSKKLFGAAAWKQAVENIEYQVGVFSFSQINLAMLPDFVNIIRREAEPALDDTVVDLYCGYGLLGAALAKNVIRVIAIDQDKSGTADARYNISRAGGRVNAIDMKIEPEALSKLFLSMKQLHPCVLILDPPRSGTPVGLIAELAAHGFRRVVTAFCGADEVRRSIAEWQAAKYSVERIVPLDFFPGTAGMEFIVSLTNKS
ncbi:MAG: methyltransferase [Ignavibacteria bacterium]|nr:methyltransferase [Ignavibacteria bacterium]